MPARTADRSRDTVHPQPGRCLSHARQATREARAKGEDRRFSIFRPSSRRTLSAFLVPALTRSSLVSASDLVRSIVRATAEPRARTRIRLCHKKPTHCRLVAPLLSSPASVSPAVRVCQCIVPPAGE